MVRILSITHFFPRGFRGGFALPVHFVLLTIMAVSYLCSVAYPFRLSRFDNHVEFEPGHAIFSRPGILLADAPLEWVREARSQNVFSAHLTVQSYSSLQYGPARILTISGGTRARNFTLGQEGPDLVVRLRRSSNTRQGIPPYIVAGLFAKEGTHEIAVDVQERWLRVWVDHALRIEEPLPEHPLSAWNESFDLALGNEVSWDRPWLGEISDARLATASMTWDLLSGDMVIVPSFVALNRFVWVGADVRDLLLNFFAFVPVGFLTAACLTPNRTLKVVLIWLPICLAGEGLQFFMVGRYPSLSDFALNLAGAICGALVLPALARRLARYRTQSSG